MIRPEKIERFLRHHGWDDAKTEKINSDASNRKYTRLFKKQNTSILMDSDPTTNESIENFIYFTKQLRKQKFSIILKEKVLRKFVCMLNQKGLKNQKN